MAEVARRLLATGMDPKVVAELTSPSIGELESVTED